METPRQPDGGDGRYEYGGRKYGGRAVAGHPATARHAADPDLAPAPLTAAKHRGDYHRAFLRLADRAGEAAAELLALAVPVECVCCGAEDRAICGACERQVRLLTRQPFRAEAQAPALVDADGSTLLPVVAAGAYRGELALALLAYKRHGQGQLADVLARGLARALRAAAGEAEGLVLVPVPTSGSAYLRRGFSPVRLLLDRADRMGRQGPSGVREPRGPTIVDALRKAGALSRMLDVAHRRAAAGARTRPSGGQKGLGRGARAQRVRGSMRARAGLRPPGVAGRPCIIVDDVLTTGATLAEAARAVRAAGGLVVGAVVLAATRPPVANDRGAAARSVAGAAAGVGDGKEKNKPKKDE